MTEEFKYDIFLSHSAKDKPTVRELAKKLRNDGFRVWLDEWEILPGDSIPIKIGDGLKNSRVLILAISANASESEWVSFEHQAILFNDPTNRGRRFIPIRLDDSEVQFYLKQFAYIDWRTQEESQYARLISVIGNVDISVPEVTEDNLVVKPLRTLRGHSGAVNSIALSSDMSLLISGSSDNTARIWDANTGDCLSVLEGHLDKINTVAITHKNEVVLSGSNDRTVRLWKTNGGKFFNISETHGARVTKIIVSADGNSVISGSADNFIRIWKPYRQSRPQIIAGHKDTVSDVLLAKDDELLFSASFDKTIRIWANWDTSDFDCINVLQGHQDRIYSIAASKDGAFIYSGSSDRTIRIWESETGKCVRIFEGHARLCRKRSFHRYS